MNYRQVLIVAKCIVNSNLAEGAFWSKAVLIVAKCIVNFKDMENKLKGRIGINSSKVYCK